MTQRTRKTAPGTSAKPVPAQPRVMLGGLDPHARAHRQRHRARHRGRTLRLDEVFDEFRKDRRRDKKLAVTFTGGGARGAYEGGVVEALVQASRRHGIVPDIVCGASVGSINSLCLFIDLMYPRSAPDPATHFLARQSAIWRSVAAGNNGAVQVVDKPWLIEFVSGKRPVPGLDDLREAWRQLSEAWNGAKEDIAAIGPAAATVASALTSVETGQLLADIQAAGAAISGDMEAIQLDWSNVLAAWEAVDLSEIFTSPGEVLSEVEGLGGAIETMVESVPALGLDLLTNTARIVSDDVEALAAFVENLAQAALQLAEAIGKIVLDGGQLAGDLVVLATWIAVALAVIFWILTHLDWLFVAVGTTVMLADHVLANTQILRLMQGFITSSMSAAGASSPGHVIDDWRRRSTAGQKVPAFYIAGTDLTADRLMVFALDELATLQAIADDGSWVCDLAHRGTVAESLFEPVPEKEEDLLARACMTSSSVPFVFPPMRWRVVREDPTGTGKTQTLEHVFVDGGVVDNTPIDLAVFAGATHIVSIELTPLLDYGSNFEVEDESMDNLVGVGARSFFTAMDGSLLRSIGDVVEVNAQLPTRRRLEIYRLAPLVPAKANRTAPASGTVEISPTLVDFDGVWNERHHLAMSLFDWFMQGYIDANGWSHAGEAAADPVVQDYFAGTAGGVLRNAEFFGNRCWHVGESPLPNPADLTAAGVRQPDRARLADEAAAR